MNKFNSTKGSSILIAIIITALVVGIGVYWWQNSKQTPLVSNTKALKEVETVNPTKLLTLKDKIEDFDSYVAIDDTEKQQMPFPPSGCEVYKDYLDKVKSGAIEVDSNYEDKMKNVNWEKYVEFSEKLKTGDMKRKEIFIGKYTSLSLILTPRYDYLDSDHDEMNKCVEGVGYVDLFKVFDNYILWGETECRGGVAFTEDEKPGITKEIEECEKVSEELTRYQNA